MTLQQLSGSFSSATKQHGAPRVMTLDGYAASHRAVAKLKTSGILPSRVQVRSWKYLNNVIEQDHRRIKQRIWQLSNWWRNGNLVSAL
jgi:transposase-like protein